MKKILELNNKTLRTGRTRSEFMEGGIWDTAKGLNPYLEDDSYRGLVAAAGSPTDLTGSTVVDTPIAYTLDEHGSTHYLYILGSGGHFYRMSNLSNTVTDLRSGTQISSPVAGMGVFQPRAASSPTLLYARAAAIGSWDLGSTYPTGWTDSAYTPGSSSSGAGIYRPFHNFFDRLYYGDGPYVSEFDDDGTSTISHATKSLDIDGTETVTAIGDDGRYLVIGASKYSDPTLSALVSSRILFWDTSADSWDWEIRLPNENIVRGIKRSGNTVYVVGLRGVYTAQFGGSATQIYSFDSDETMLVDSDSFAGTPYAINAWGDGIIFGKIGTAVSKYLPGTDRIIYNPLPYSIVGNITLIITDFEENKVIVGTDEPKLYKIDLSSSGTSGTFTTRRIPLGDLYHLQRLDIELPLGIGASDEIHITVHGSDSSITLSSITRAAYGDKTFLRIFFNKNITTSYTWLEITPYGGAPAIGALSLWGEAATSA